MRFVIGPLVVVAVTWGALALYYAIPGPRIAGGSVALAFIVASAVLVLAVRPRRRGVIGFALLFAAVLGGWLLIPARADRDWQPDVARLASADIQGDVVTVHNVRNNEYRSETDYTVRHEDWRVSLADLRGLDVFLVYWGSPSIAHVIMSFGFADGRHLAFSIETRKQKGQDYSAIRGFFKQYELVYVVATEPDVIRLRTNFRREDVYLYRLRARPQILPQVFLNYLREINRLHEHPQWYNALTENCTTAIRGLAPPDMVRVIPHWKVLLNGHLDELLYERGAVDRSLPFPVLRERSRINERALAVPNPDDFSAKIREGLPGGPA